jgi:hypothetical protein
MKGEKEKNKAVKLEIWKKIRTKGTFHFIFSITLLFTAIGTISTFISKYFIYPEEFQSLLNNRAKLIFHFVYPLICGLIISNLIWFFSESSYQRSLNNKDFNIWIPKQKNPLK